jgi:hypothetical protein
MEGSPLKLIAQSGPTIMPTSSKALWIDVSPILDGSSCYAESKRVLFYLVEKWLEQRAPSVRWCRFDLVLGAYREIQSQAIEEAIANWRTGWLGFGKQAERGTPQLGGAVLQTVRAMAKTVFQSLPWELQGACRRLARGARTIWHDRCYQAKQLTPFPVLPANSARLRGPTIFGPGDTLLILGPGEGVAAPAFVQAVQKVGLLRVAIFVSDLIPLSLPHLCEPGLVARFHPWLLCMLKVADLVVTVARDSARELSKWCEREALCQPLFEVIRLGDEPDPQVLPAHPRALPGWVTGPFVLADGVLDARKNPGLLYQAWRQLVDRHGSRMPLLVLAGAQGWLSNDIIHLLRTDPLIRDRIVLLTDLTDPELRWLYDNCQFTVFPSVHETWALPVGQSLALGKVCVCPQFSSLQEIAGDLAASHDPFDLPALVALLETFLFVPGRLGEAERRIREHFRTTSWASAAGQVLRAVSRIRPDQVLEAA